MLKRTDFLRKMRHVVFQNLPLLVLISGAFCLFMSLVQLSWLFSGLALVIFYLIPPLAFRLHVRISPIQEGGSELTRKGLSSWELGRRLQDLYLVLPFLERALRLMPGAYSTWLRLWGSRIGRDVHWSIDVEIEDRNLLDIGDRVHVSSGVRFYNHVISLGQGIKHLFVQKTKVSEGAFLGRASSIGPGVRIDSGCQIMPNTHLGVGEIVTGLEWDEDIATDAESSPLPAAGLASPSMTATKEPMSSGPTPSAMEFVESIEVGQFQIEGHRIQPRRPIFKLD